jgi:hypothetical protein
MNINWLNLPSPLAVVALKTNRGEPTLTELAVMRLEPDRPPTFLDSRVVRSCTPGGPPAFVHLVPRLRELLRGAILVAHGTAEVSNALDAELWELGGGFSHATLCTRRLARRTRPGRSSQLPRLARELGIPCGASSWSKACATAQVLSTLATDPQLVRGCLHTPRRPTAWPRVFASLVAPWPARLSVVKAGASAQVPAPLL